MSESKDNPWPPSGDQSVLFIVDAGHRAEADLLTDWLREFQPEGAPLAQVAILDIARQQESIDAAPLIPFLDLAEETEVVPLRIVWRDGGDERRTAPRFRDLLFRDRKPGLGRALRILEKHPGRARRIAAASATLGELKTRFVEQKDDDQSPASLAFFIADQAGLALDIAERKLRGGRYKVPRRVASNLKASKGYRDALKQVALETGEPVDALEARAEEIFKELIAIPRTFWQDVLAVFNRKVIGMGYQPEFVIDQDNLNRMRDIVRSKPSVLLWTHKTHVDGFAVYSMLFENDFPVPHVLGGVNMAFAGLGYAARRSGAIFIRRSFQDDLLYKMILRQYIGYLLQKRFPLTWAFEGTRSRVGKLMPPRYGLLKYVAEAVVSSDAEDLHIIPVALNYDLIGDVKDYVREQSGAVKQPESLRWFIGYLRGLRRPLGKIYIDFGEPVLLTEAIAPDEPLALKKIALQVGVEANRVTPLTLASLVSTILLGMAPRALTRYELSKQMFRIVRWARERGIRIASDFDEQGAENLNALADVLGDNGLVTRFDEGPDVVYTIAPEQHRVASYYRNTTIHHFVTKAIAEMALVTVADVDEDRVAAFHAEVVRLRDLFKFEFFYTPSDAFIREVDDEMGRYDANWQASLAADEDYARRFLRRFRPLMARATLLPFVEAYQVVANVLSSLDADEAIDAKACLEQSLALGRQAYLQRRISSEASIGKLFFQNAYTMMENRGLMDITDASLKQRRQAMSQCFRDLATRLEQIRAMTLPGDRW